MRIGRMRRRVVLEELRETQDEYNDTVEKWDFYGKAWAGVEDLRGQNFHLGRQVPGSEVTTQVEIRYRAGIKPLKFRVIDGARVLLVQAVTDPEGRHRKLDLMCKEVISGSN